MGVGQVRGSGRRWERRRSFVCLCWIDWLAGIFESPFSRNIYPSFISNLQFNSCIIGYNDHFKHVYTNTTEKWKNLSGCQDTLYLWLWFYQFPVCLSIKSEAEKDILSTSGYRVEHQGARFVLKWVTPQYNTWATV